MENKICGVGICARNATIIIKVFNAISEGEDGHAVDLRVVTAR